MHFEHVILRLDRSFAGIRRGILPALVLRVLIDGTAVAALPPDTNGDSSVRPVGIRGETGDTSATGTPDVDFWIGLDMGYGLASPICAACGENGPLSGTTANFYLGFGVGKNILIGMQPSLWIIDGGIFNNRHDHIGRHHFMVIGYYYPESRPGFYGKAGFGLSAYSAYDRYRPALKDINGRDLPSLVRSDGPGVLLGAGSDFRVAGKLFLNFTLTYFYGHLGPLLLDETHDLKVARPLHLVECNIGFMFRPRNM